MVAHDSGLPPRDVAEARGPDCGARGASCADEEAGGLVTRVRRIGFGRSYDVGAALYYRLECEHWIELERAKK